MEWQRISKDDNGHYVIPKRWLHIYYYDALNVLFRVENALRVFVYAVLKNEWHEKWSQLSITSEDSEEGTIESIAKKRRAQASKFGYLGFPIPCPIMHLTTGELIGIIVSDAYWKSFSKYFPGSKEIIKNKLDEIGVVRNALAHFRPLKEDDVEVAKQNAKHALMSVEKYLSEMLHCSTIIPTNTKDVWYKELSTLGNEYCALKYFQSKDQQWVRISFEYRPVLVRRVVWETHSYASYTVLNLISSAFLTTHPDLAKLVTFTYESTYDYGMDEKINPKTEKDINLVFRRSVVEKQYDKIRKSIEELLQQIASEAELIKIDNLARGEIVETARISAFLRKGGEVEHWNLNIDALTCEVKEEDPVEYWGDLGLIEADFVASTPKFPWMSMAISSEDYISR